MQNVRLTKAQTRVLDVIQESIKEQGRPPTRAEIADALGFRSVNAAESHLRALERRGAIRLQGGASRGIQCLIPLDDTPNEDAGLPLIGRVAAGVPIDSFTHVERRVQVSAGLFSPQPDYLLRVVGDSMIKVGIFDGDLLAVKKAITATSGEIVVARVDGEVTVKRLQVATGVVTLLPENDHYAPISIADPDDLIIEGLAVGVIRPAL